MRALRHWIKVFFGFSRTETNGFLILLPLTAIVLFSAPLYQAIYPKRAPANDDARLDSLLKTLVWETKDSIPPVLFAFDPNLVSDSMLIRMGLSARMAGRWVNFRNKGGQFRTWHDVNKLFGIDSGWVQRAIPYMRFPVAKTFKSAKAQANQTLLDINEADTIQLDAVYGIGPALARRITTYRNRLGGFISMDQLHEVYGLDSVVVKNLKKKFFVAPDFKPLRISLQEATAEELSRHPYVHWKEATAIVAWRMQHKGKITRSDLEQIHGITTGWVLRIEPYLLVEP